MTNTGISDRSIQLWLITVLATCLFIVMFIFEKAGPFDFWYWMSSNLLLLLILVFVFDRSNGSKIKEDLKSGPLHKMLLGIAAALFLFVIFYAGNILIRLIFERAGEGIQKVYSFRQEASPIRIHGQGRRA